MYQLTALSTFEPESSSHHLEGARPNGTDHGTQSSAAAVLLLSGAESKLVK
jgi:hypothetical protein